MAGRFSPTSGNPSTSRTPATAAVPESMGQTIELAQQLAAPAEGSLRRQDGEATSGEAAEVDPRVLRWNNEAIVLAQQQQYGAAVQKLRYARALQPEAEMVEKNLQQVLTAWGIERMRAEDFLKARDLLEEAYELGTDPTIAYALGTAWRKTGEERRAQALWEAMLDRYPQDGRLLLALAQLYEDQGWRAEALDLYQSARSAGVQAEGLAERIQRLEREVDAEWDLSVHATPHFRFRVPDSASHEEVRSWMDLFESARAHVASFFGFAGPEEIEVVLYDSRHFGHVTRAPGWAAGAYTGRVQLSVDSARKSPVELERIARHELAHAFLSTLGSNDAPAWLSEGLALHAEEDVAGEKRPWAEAAVRRDPALSLQRLPPSFLSLGDEQAKAAYALSYLAVAALLEQKGVRAAVELLRVPRGTTFADHFRAVTGESWPDFASQVHAGVQ